jgi:chromosomal replication initiation ATPase DnaA
MNPTSLTKLRRTIPEATATARDISANCARIQSAALAVVRASRRLAGIMESQSSLLNSACADGRVETIQAACAEFFSVPIDAMVRRQRTDEYVTARQAAMWFSRRLTNVSTTDLGSAFGGRDHATVIYAERAMNDRISTDADFRDKMAALTEIINRRLARQKETA